MIHSEKVLQKHKVYEEAHFNCTAPVINADASYFYSRAPDGIMRYHTFTDHEVNVSLVDFIPASGKNPEDEAVETQPEPVVEVVAVEEVQPEPVVKEKKKTTRKKKGE